MKRSSLSPYLTRCVNPEIEARFYKYSFPSRRSVKLELLGPFIDIVHREYHIAPSGHRGPPVRIFMDDKFAESLGGELFSGFSAYFFVHQVHVGVHGQIPEINWIPQYLFGHRATFNEIYGFYNGRQKDLGIQYQDFLLPVA